MPAARFKVGDKVLVKAGRSTHSHLLNGRICTVKSVDSGFEPYATLVEEPRLSGVWFTELKLVSSWCGFATQFKGALRGSEGDENGSH